MAKKKKHYVCGDIVKVNESFNTVFSPYKIIIGSYGDICGGNYHDVYQVMDIFKDGKGCTTHAWVYIGNIEGKVGNISKLTDMFEKKLEKKKIEVIPMKNN